MTNGVEGNVDDLEELHVHAWLHPGGGGNGVEDVLWSVELQEGVEGGDPHLGGLGWVGEDRGQDWDDQVWVLEASVHQGVDSKDPGTVKCFAERVLNSSGQQLIFYVSIFCIRPLNCLIEGKSMTPRQGNTFLFLSF